MAGPADGFVLDNVRVMRALVAARDEAIAARDAAIEAEGNAADSVIEAEAYLAQITSLIDIIQDYPDTVSSSQNQTFIFLDYVSGPTHNMVTKLALNWQTITGNYTQYKFVLIAPLQKGAGEFAVSIRNYANTATLLPNTVVRSTTGVTLPLAAFEASDMLIFRRDATTLLGRMCSPPNTSQKTITEANYAQTYHIPTTVKPIVAYKETDKIWHIKGRNVEGATRDDTISMTKMYNLAQFDSVGVFRNTNNWDIDAMELTHQGRRFAYGMMSSTETSPSVFTNASPSITSPVTRVHYEGDPYVGTHAYGYGHSYVEDYSTTFTMDGVAKDVAAVYGTEYNGSELILTTNLSVFMPEVTVAADRWDDWLGNLEYKYVWDEDGLHLTATSKVGPRVPFENGSIEVVEGDIIDGTISGAQGLVVYVPDLNATGEWVDGDRAGVIFIKPLNAFNFVAADDLQVGGVTVANASGDQSRRIMLRNSYGPLMVTKVINRAKLVGYPALDCDFYDNSDRELWTGTRPTAANNLVQCWHTDDEDVLLNMHLPSGPSTPPGDYSEALTSVIFVQCKAEGHRKIATNTQSSNTTSIPYAGTYVSEVRYQFSVDHVAI
jgi:hypothetical protein